jgi:hypothetical protein
MMRLDVPASSHEQALDKCIAGVLGNDDLLTRIQNSRAMLLAEGRSYSEHVSNGDLFTIQPITTQPESEGSLFGELDKSDLIKMYSQYFADKDKPARRIYNDLLNAARDHCPFCGGIGSPRTLDHFLPKKLFPQFSILPFNLVPSCRDCNMEAKAQSFASRAEDQCIHPYGDRETFFTDQWICARYIPSLNHAPGRFMYYISAPHGATSLDDKRVQAHFRDFGIAKRYSTKAGENLGTVLSQIQNMRAGGLSDCKVVEYLLQPGVDLAPFINHWHRGMYQALIASLGHI